jgi:hypothetical protein
MSLQLALVQLMHFWRAVAYSQSAHRMQSLAPMKSSPQVWHLSRCLPGDQNPFFGLSSFLYFMVISSLSVLSIRGEIINMFSILN